VGHFLLVAVRSSFQGANAGKLSVPDSEELIMTEKPARRRRWFHITPDRLILGVLAVEGFLFLSEQFQWFAFNEIRGWTVLVAVSVVCLAVVVMLLWLGASLLFRRRFQFGVRSLLVLFVAVAVPLTWFGIEKQEAERQQQTVEAIEEAGGGASHDYVSDATGVPEPPAPGWLTELLGVDFFANVTVIWLSDTKAGDAVVAHLKRLTSLEGLDLNGTQVTDAALQHVKGLTNLHWLVLFDTQITDAGLEHVKGLTNLEYLELSNSQCSDAGLEHLTGLTNLKTLGLDGTQVTDVGLKNLKTLTNLKWLNLSETQVTEEGINELEEALPNCEIRWSPLDNPNDQP
jgi:hypothetical protein